VQGLVGFCLHDLDQLLAQELEDRDKGHGHAEPALFGPEQPDELDQPDALEQCEHVRHALAH